MKTTRSGVVYGACNAEVVPMEDLNESPTKKAKVLMAKHELQRKYYSATVMSSMTGKFCKPIIQKAMVIPTPEVPTIPDVKMQVDVPVKVEKRVVRARTMPPCPRIYKDGQWQFPQAPWVNPLTGRLEMISDGYPGFSDPVIPPEPETWEWQDTLTVKMPKKVEDWFAEEFLQNKFY
jgi:hypothetical protein